MFSKMRSGVIDPTILFIRGRETKIVSEDYVKKNSEYKSKLLECDSEIIYDVFLNKYSGLLLKQIYQGWWAHLGPL